MPIYERVLKTMNVPKSGVFILLDDGENPAYGNPRYSRAFYMNIRIGGIEEMSPDHVLEIIRKPDCKYFLWISPSVFNGSEFYAAWVFAHELQHLIQDINYPELAKVGTFLYYAHPAIKSGAQLTQLDLPAELDAEIKAKQITISLFGLESYQAFIKKEQILHGDSKIEYHKKLQRLESAYSGYRQETLLLLCGSMDQLIGEQKRLNSKGRNFDFDIAQLCASHRGN